MENSSALLLSECLESLALQRPQASTSNSSLIPLIIYRLDTRFLKHERFLSASQPVFQHFESLEISVGSAVLSLSLYTQGELFLFYQSAFSLWYLLFALSKSPECLRVISLLFLPCSYTSLSIILLGRGQSTLYGISLSPSALLQPLAYNPCAFHEGLW